jgi:hypothetical protein
MENKERLKIVIKHLIEHNHGHHEDYARWIALADETGSHKVADLLKEASYHSEEAGKALDEALKLLV